MASPVDVEEMLKVQRKQTRRRLELEQLLYKVRQQVNPDPRVLKGIEAELAKLK